MRNFINLIETNMSFDRQREEDFLYKINQLLSDAVELDRGLKELNVSPTMLDKLDESSNTIISYLRGLSKHATHNLK